VVHTRCRDKLTACFNETQYNIPEAALFPEFFGIFILSILTEMEFVLMVKYIR
jgi:hypothetical protein